MRSKTGNAAAAAPVATRRWSPRSQRILKKQFELEAKVTACEGSIRLEEGKKKAAEANRDRQSDLVQHGQGFYRRNLADSLAEIAESDQMIGAYRDKVEKLRGEIATLQPTPAQAEERAAKQDSIAALVNETQGEVLSLDAALADVRKRLKTILALKTRLKEQVQEIDLQVGPVGLGETVFERLLAALPEALGPDAMGWSNWVLGNEKMRECIIKEETEVFAETLAAAHFYRRGDVARLNARDHKVATFEPPHTPSPMETEELFRKQAVENRASQTFYVGDPNIRLAGSGF